MSRGPNVHVSFLSSKDRARAIRAAKLNGYKTFSEWIRSLINGNFLMMGWKSLESVVKTCRKGHEYSKENTGYVMTKGKKYRSCKICSRYHRRRFARKKAIKDRKLGIVKRKLYFKIIDQEAKILLNQDKINKLTEEP